jgi:hypothetical protein
MRWWQIRKRDADLERELQSDLELEEEEQRERGLSPEEARHAALRAFGNPTLCQPPGLSIYVTCLTSVGSGTHRGSKSHSPSWLRTRFSTNFATDSTS